jgi:hypothetical protein
VSERYETTIDRHLADLLVENLRRALAAAGFDEVLHIPSPDVSEFRRGHEVLTLTRDEGSRHRHRLSIEGEATDVQPFVGEAARQSVLEVCRELLAAMPWVDREALEKDLDQLLREVLVKVQS